jgi:hypothetical protein
VRIQVNITAPSSTTSAFQTTAESTKDFNETHEHFTYGVFNSTNVIALSPVVENPKADEVFESMAVDEYFEDVIFKPVIDEPVVEEVEILSCVDQSGIGTFLFVSRHPLNNVRVEWGYRNLSFMNLVTMNGGKSLPYWVSKYEVRTPFYIGVLTHLYEGTVPETITVKLVGHVYNSSSSFITTRTVRVGSPVDLEIHCEGNDNDRTISFIILSRRPLESVRISLTVGVESFIDYVLLKEGKIAVAGAMEYRSNCWVAQLTHTLNFSVPDKAMAQVSGWNGSSCFTVTTEIKIVRPTVAPSTERMPTPMSSSSTPSQGITISKNVVIDLEVLSNVNQNGIATLLFISNHSITNMSVIWDLQGILFIAPVHMDTGNPLPNWATGYRKRQKYYVGTIHRPLQDTSVNLTSVKITGLDVDSARTFSRTKRIVLEKPAMVPTSDAGVGSVVILSESGYSEGDDIMISVEIPLTDKKPVLPESVVCKVSRAGQTEESSGLPENPRCTVMQSSDLQPGSFMMLISSSKLAHGAYVVHLQVNLFIDAQVIYSDLPRLAVHSPNQPFPLLVYDSKVSTEDVL